MFKHTSSRNQRSKGFKLKHAVQICVLVAVCIWLLYQVKHSHDKKELEERHSNPVAIVGSKAEILRFGRKDLPDVKNDNDASKEEENEEEAGEHEAKKQEGEEEEDRGAGEDESDENDREKGEEVQHGEELGDDEENEVKSDELALTGKDNNDDDEDMKSQEAREEHYKGDDASSAVVRGVETLESEEEQHGTGNDEEENTKNEHDPKIDGDETNGNDDAHKAGDSGDNAQKEEVDAHLFSNTSSNLTHLAEDVVHMDGTLSNSTIPELSEKSEQLNNSTLETASNHSEDEDGKISQDNSTTVIQMVTEDLSSNNVTVSMSSEGGQNSTTDVEALTVDKIPESGNNGDSKSGDTTVELNEKTNMVGTAGGLEEASGNSSSPDDGGETVANKSGESAREDALSDEEKDARTDLSTLPQIQMETRSIEDIAAE